MNPSPPGNEKPTGNGGLLRTDATETLADSCPRVNGKPIPPAGYGHVYDDDGNRETVPITFPPQEQEPFTADEKQRLDIILPVLRWAIGSKSRLAALEYLGQLDKRTAREIARSNKISASAVHREIRNLRAFLEALR